MLERKNVVLFFLLLLVLVLSVVLASKGVVADRWCYQEDSLTHVCNTTAQIGTGSESTTGTFVARQGGANVYDSSWSTYALGVDGSTTSFMFIKYMKPTLLENESIAIGSSLWQVKGSQSAVPILVTSNNSIPVTGNFACRQDGDYLLSFRVQSNDEKTAGTGESMNSWNCWNGSIYSTIVSYGGCTTSANCARAYEEGVWWRIRTEPSYSLIVDCKPSNAGNCTGSNSSFYTTLTPKTFNITAIANSGYKFSNWSDSSAYCTVYNISNPNTNVTITTGNCIVTGNFVETSTGNTTTCNQAILIYHKQKRTTLITNCDNSIYIKQKRSSWQTLFR